MTYDTHSFVSLIERARTYGLDPTDTPRTRREVAESCGISRAHLYKLLEGETYPRPHIRERISRGLATLADMKVSRVRAVLDAEWDL